VSIATAQALDAPLPENWKEAATEDGTVYYKNNVTGAINWSHPLDDQFRSLYVQMKVPYGYARLSHHRT